MAVVKVAQVGDIPEGDCLVVELNNVDVAIFHVGKDYYAINDRCLHAGASLAGGPVEDGIVTCPWHYWRFCLKDGTWMDNPRIKTRSYDVTIVDEDIYLEAKPIA